MPEWTEERHAEVKGRCGRARPGPWTKIDLDRPPNSMMGWENEGDIGTPDETFMAYAQVDLTDAIVEIERLRETQTKKFYHDPMYLSMCEELDEILQVDNGIAYVDSVRAAVEERDELREENAMHRRKFAHETCDVCGSSHTMIGDDL